VSISGPWVLHFSWGCSNSYGQQPLTFNSDGTFSGSLPGKWVQQDGTILLSFDNSTTRYGGTIDGSVGSGAHSNFSGAQGCWYLVQQGVTGSAEATESIGEQSRDAAGNRTDRVIE
jgi:hypothetical protein